MGTLLNDFLTRNKKSQDTISKATYNHLLKIEKVINEREKHIAESKQIIKDNTINICTISNATKIARKTFYNNKILNDFVNEHSTQQNDASKNEIIKLKEKLSDYQDKINKLLDRDLEMVKSINEKVKLENELKCAYSRIESLEKQHELDLKKLKSLNSNPNNGNKKFS